MTTAQTTEAALRAIGLGPAHRVVAPALPVLAGFTRERLAEALSGFGFTAGVELGVLRGAYGAILAAANPGMTFTGIDHWAPYRVGPAVVSAAEQEAGYQAALARLAPYPNYTLLRQTSLQAVDLFRRHSLDFVYLDDDHEFGHVAQELAAWTPKVKGGGIVAGHDFKAYRWRGHRMHVVEAVTGFLAAKHIESGFVLPASHAKDNPSWAFIVPDGYRW